MWYSRLRTRVSRRVNGDDMARTHQGISGLDIRQDCICMAHYLPEQNSVAWIVINPLESAGEQWWEEAGQELKRLVKEIKLTGQDVVVSLPAESTVLKKVVVESDEEDIERAVEWEMGQQVLGTFEEYAFDFAQMTAQAGEGLRQYLVAASRRDRVKRVVDLVRASRLNPVVMDIDVCAAVNVFEANYGEKTASPAVLVLGDDERLKLVLTLNGELVDFEVMQYSHNPAAPDACGAAIKEGLSLLRTANAGLWCEGSPEVFVGGALFADRQLVHSLCEELSQVETLHPFRVVSCGAEMSEDDLVRHGPHLAVATGLALRGGIDAGL